jgi:hypothetical protein
MTALFEDELWYLAQQSRVLQDFRLQIRTLWEDEAARDINMRYLSPHQDDNARMIESFQLQRQNLLYTEEKIALSEEHADEAEKYSTEVNLLIEYVDEDIHVAYQFNEQYKGHIAVANSLIPEVEELIESANCACEGVPTA